jgi:hypothetical protein
MGTEEEERVSSTELRWLSPQSCRKTAQAWDAAVQMDSTGETIRRVSCCKKKSKKLEGSLLSLASCKGRAPEEEGRLTASG